MQWQGFIMRQRKGMISLSILLLTTVLLTILQGFFLLVNRESEAQTDNIRQEQILNLGESLIRIAGRNEEKGNLNDDIQLQKVTLYPGNEEFTTKISNENDISLGVRQIKISFESSSKKWNIYKDRLLPQVVLIIRFIKMLFMPRMVLPVTNQLVLLFRKVTAESQCHPLMSARIKNTVRWFCQQQMS